MLFLSMCIASCNASSSVGTAWWDINPTSTVENVIGDAGFAMNAKLVELSEEAISKNVALTDKYGEDQNVAVQIGINATAAVSNSLANAAKSNTVIRSVSVAIGAESDATNAKNPLSN